MQPLQFQCPCGSDSVQSYARKLGPRAKSHCERYLSLHCISSRMSQEIYSVAHQKDSQSCFPLPLNPPSSLILPHQRLFCSFPLVTIIVWRWRESLMTMHESHLPCYRNSACKALESGLILNIKYFICSRFLMG